MVRHWFAAHEVLREDAGRLSRLHVVKYEELLSDPAGRLADIQHFLGLAEPFATDLFRGGHSDQYEARWDAMAGQPLGSRIRRSVERDFADQAAEFGYDIADLHVQQPWVLDA